MSSLAPVSAVSPTPSLASLVQPRGAATASPSPDQMRQTFQEAVGSLFYGQMIKALRSGVGKPAYIHGGQAEEMFQGQMDQQVAENLARHQGGALVEDLYQRFLVDHPEGREQAPAELSALLQSVKSLPTAESAQEASWARPLTSGSRNTIDTAVIPVLNRK